MHQENKDILLVAMPFAETSIPSIQLALIETYLKSNNLNIKTLNLYLKAADIFGLENYNYLINSPNDPYTAQMIFSKYLFKDYFKKNHNDFKEFYNRNSSKNSLSFEDYEELTDKFYKWTNKNVKWNDFDIIGFSLNYGQFLPSIAVAKEIKKNYPDKKILLGGSSTIDELGRRVLKTFDWVDFIITGEGEEALHSLAADFENYKSIPGLIYRDGKNIIFNNHGKNINLDALPFLNYNSYFRDLTNSSAEIQQYFNLYGRLPIEFSRGCWWNKCSFCNIGAYHKNYREKGINRFVEELDYLSETYKMLDFQIISNTLPQKDYRLLCEEIIRLQKDFCLCIEARSGRLKSNDYALLKKAGFRIIQTGIETFSSNYIKKMNKGAKVIDNIAALKSCKENGINNYYNLIVNYPNEEEVDFEETVKNTSLFWQYLDPPQISEFVVGYNSPIFFNTESYNINNLDAKKTDKIMYPQEILNEKFLFFYNFERKVETKENNWTDFVKKWKENKEKSELNAIKSKKLIDKFIFYFVDGEKFLKIYDKRNGKNVMIYTLDDIERKIFLSCLDVISFSELEEKFHEIPDYQLAAILHSFEKTGLVFKEDELYLSLPLDFSKLMGTYKEIDSEPSELIVSV